MMRSKRTNVIGILVRFASVCFFAVVNMTAGHAQTRSEIQETILARTIVSDFFRICRQDDLTVDGVSALAAEQGWERLSERETLMADRRGVLGLVESPPEKVWKLSLDQWSSYSGKTSVPAFLYLSRTEDSIHCGLRITGVDIDFLEEAFLSSGLKVSDLDLTYNKNKLDALTGYCEALLPDDRFHYYFLGHHRLGGVSHSYLEYSAQSSHEGGCGERWLIFCLCDGMVGNLILPEIPERPLDNID